MESAEASEQIHASAYSRSATTLEPYRMDQRRRGSSVTLTMLNGDIKFKDTTLAMAKPRQ